MQFRLNIYRTDLRILTRFISSFCDFFGIPNGMYSKKMQRAEANAIKGLKNAPYPSMQMDLWMYIAKYTFCPFLFAEQHTNCLHRNNSIRQLSYLLNSAYTIGSGIEVDPHPAVSFPYKIESGVSGQFGVKVPLRAYSAVVASTEDAQPTIL